MAKANRASFEFTLSWQSAVAQHRDRLFSDKIDFWRDIFPDTMESDIRKLQEGETASATFAAGVLVPPFAKGQVFRFPASAFETKQRDRTLVPRLGRFYPQGFAWSAMNCYKGDFTPFRLVGMDENALTADTNHPLARYPLTLDARYISNLGDRAERGGVCNHIGELATLRGPGMQAAYPGLDTDFHAEEPLPRRNAADDAVFYAAPRMLPHLDAAASEQLRALHARLLTPGQQILDLMSSWTSHLPDNATDCRVTGLGMNAEEMRANPRLTEAVVHDLNRDPRLPFADQAFDAVICTASIEYLTRPRAVLAEVARVLRPGGTFVTSFSERWFPGKEIMAWSDMHPFERLGCVLDLYRQSGAFDRLQTESIRGLPRPLDDRHIRETFVSDPIYAVWGRRKA